MVAWCKTNLCLVLLCCCCWALRAEAMLPVVVQQQLFKADFAQPTAVVTDAQGRLYVVDGGNQRIAVLSSTGQLLNEFTGLHLPMALALDKERLAVSDSGNQRIVIFNLSGQVLQTIVPASLAIPKPLGAPRPVGVWLQNDTLYWSDQTNHQICNLALRSNINSVAHCFGQRGEIEGAFQYPFQISADQAGYLHVVDVLNARIQVFNAKGQWFSQIGRFGLNAGELYRPQGVALDAQDTVYIADNYFGTIAIFKSGRFLGHLQDAQGKVVQFNSPVALHWQQNQLYVVDSLNQAVYRLSLEVRSVSPPKSHKPIVISQKNCVLCHLDWATANTELAPAREPEVMAVASSKMCYSCHNGVVMDSRLLIQHGAQHPSVDDAEKDKVTRKHMDERKDKMPALFPLTDNKEMRCTTCHTPHSNNDKHETLHPENRNAWLRVPTHNGDLCERCHESKQKLAREYEAKKRGLNHPLGSIFAPAPKKDDSAYVKETKLAHGLPEALRKGFSSLDKQQRLICQSCHQIHGGHDKELLIVSQEHGRLCVLCHESKNAQDKKAAHHKGIHPINEKLEKPITRKQEKITHVSCQSCHKVHSGSIGTALLPAAAKSSDEICADCHQRQTAKGKKHAHEKGVHPVNFQLAELKLKEPLKFGKPGDKHALKEITCTTCHAVHSGSPDTAALVNDVKKTVELCVDCHQHQHAKDKDDARKKGVHPVNFKLKEPLKFGKEQIHEITCITCHSMHDGGSPSTAALVNQVKTTEALCEDCHKRQHAGDKAQALPKGLHPVAGKLDEPVKINQEEVNKIGCLTCHSVHQGVEETPALREPFKNGELCEHCHAQKQAVVGTDHDLRISAKDSKNHYDQLPLESGVCGACHSMHQHTGDEHDTRSQLHLDAVKAVGNLNVTASLEQGKSVQRDVIQLREDKLCLNCHQAKGIAEQKIINHFSHPYQDMILRSDKNVMPLLDKQEKVAEFGAIACITCHEPHSWKALDKKTSVLLSTNQQNLEGTMLNSFLRHKDIKGTFCVSCHGLEALAKYKYYHDGKLVRAIGVNYLR